ncbi:hypothetical protein E1286_05095 [Nonomuraea terrae]|uniref:Uncharacterized protein n=1 Tax=Nonomuraea terrae TaxID=2530383 RepID=A0A4R4ZBL7_9ACTN|nr:hypothetical protein [Nonomuraea terrae]TDD54569.1 hypothetical protein E1286_05095 [Nonomuraea terrae]
MSQHTYDHFAALRDALQHFDTALLPGTPRRWAERDLTPQQRDRMNQRAIEEREDKVHNLARGLKALGDGKAPLRLEVLDAAADITASVAELEDAVCDALGLTQLQKATTVDRIRRIVDLLDRIDLHEDLADHVHHEAQRLRRLASSAIGDAETVRKLKFRCHICDATSMRAFPERELIICVNSECRCDDAECPCGWERPQRHKWTFDQWPWLASLLDEGIGVDA